MARSAARVAQVVVTNLFEIVLPSRTRHANSVCFSGTCMLVIGVICTNSAGNTVTEFGAGHLIGKSERRAGLTHTGTAS